MARPLDPSVYAGKSSGTSNNQTKGSFVDTVRFIRYSDQNVALEQVKQGKIAIYYFAIPLEVVSEMMNNPDVKIYDRMAGTFGLLFNPAPYNESSKSLNPFQIREVRYAMNFLVNREFVVDEILKGYGSVLIDPFGQYSPEYLNLIDTVESLGIRYAPGLGDQMINDALVKEGAVKDRTTGKWFFADKPITVKILIRSDDPRRKSLGDLVSAELERVGFSVLKQYGDLNKANAVVSGSNPQDFQWHVYTEAYAGTSAFVKYNPVITSQMYAPYAGNMPGGQNPAFWNYQNSSIDDITQKINFFNFTSEEQRNALVRNATRAGIQESVRIFIAQNTDPYIANSDVAGLINDFGAGITSRLSLINAQPPDLSLLNIGVKEIYQGAWNSVGGCGDTYCTSIYSALADGATFRNPYTGEVIPMRNIWTDIITTGPTERMKVAADAQTWDPYSKQWKKAGSDTFALSKVDYKLLFSKWHHGITMDKSDILYPLYFAFEWGTDQGRGDLTVDPEYTAAAKESLPYAKGIRFINDTEIESFVDQWHYDKNEIAGTATAWSAEPWEITAATERLVMEGKVAYSRGQATAKNVPWLSLIVPSHAKMILAELQKMKSESFIPTPLKGIVTIKEANQRYDAAIQWIEQHRHAVISNGPFYLDAYDPSAGIIYVKAFRDASYPFRQGYWSVFENPKLAIINAIDTQKYLVPGEPLKVQINVTVGGKPSNDAVVDYFLSDTQGRVILNGKAEPLGSTTTMDGLSSSLANTHLTNVSVNVDNGLDAAGNIAGVSDSFSQKGIFEITLNSSDTLQLHRGPNSLKIFAYTEEAFRPDIHTIPLLVVTD
ncbi:MAG TPA: ABC transporter substrate-binding protein [Nitrososphaeraceae archaeon]|nr:ABC transporter substrate-binding protein [Nitrososphaeraceae archaeon]